jgi:hypothetical protein
MIRIVPVAEPITVYRASVMIRGAAGETAKEASE